MSGTENGAPQIGGPQIGDRAPDFDLPATGGGRVNSATLRGRPFVLYFYPKADTSACTQEAVAFGPLGERIAVVGVSRDPLRAVERFAAKHGIGFPLGSDPDGTAAMAYGCWVEKSMYGRRYMGVERSTFLVDADGVVRGAWRKVTVPGHAAAVETAAAALERTQP
ncbi:MAG: peroxiredoxin [Gluconacetobacter diazotrophicus]|nr:peroxiredoxin [Gluconacetobacter diazotrophicus]